MALGFYQAFPSLCSFCRKHLLGFLFPLSQNGDVAYYSEWLHDETMDAKHLVTPDTWLLFNKYLVVIILDTFCFFFSLFFSFFFSKNCSQGVSLSFPSSLLLTNSSALSLRPKEKHKNNSV